MLPFRRDWLRRSYTSAVIAALLCAVPLPLSAREKDATDYGVGLTTNIPLPEDEVAQVVSDVVHNGIIRGTKEYNRDEYIQGADATEASNLFPAWIEGGKVFYKVRKQALDPRNFKESNDVGTIAVRYVVQSQGEKNTVLRVDAIFVEDFRHTVHLSNGSVEGSEFKLIQDKLDAIELMKKEAVAAAQKRQELRAKKNFGMDAGRPDVTVPSPETKPADSQTRKDSDAETNVAEAVPGETLEQHVANLRHELQRLVKAPGAPLKTAPFHSASTLKTLPSGTEVLIVITTRYWLGVETREGQHGWIPREQLEFLP